MASEEVRCRESIAKAGMVSQVKAAQSSALLAVGSGQLHNSLVSVTRIVVANVKASVRCSYCRISGLNFEDHPRQRRDS